MEAERIKKEEEEILKKQMNAKKAKQEAERLHKVCPFLYFFIQHIREFLRVHLMYLGKV